MYDMPRSVQAMVDAIDGATPLVVVDVETTGLLIEGEPMPKIWEIAALRISGLKRTEFRVLVDIGEPIPDAANLTGVDPTLPMREGIALQDALRALCLFIGDGMVIGHYASKFDAPIIRAAADSTANETLIYAIDDIFGKVLDTKYIAADLWQWMGRGPTSNKLASLATWYGVDCKGGHRAAVDVQVLDYVIGRMYNDAVRFRIYGS